jgi:hypothetical protein
MCEEAEADLAIEPGAKFPLIRGRTNNNNNNNYNSSMKEM